MPQEQLAITVLHQVPQSRPEAAGEVDKMLAEDIAKMMAMVPLEETMSKNEALTGSREERSSTMVSKHPSCTREVKG